jgi:hypothetical protein
MAVDFYVKSLREGGSHDPFRYAELLTTLAGEAAATTTTIATTKITWAVRHNNDGLDIELTMCGFCGGRLICARVNRDQWDGLGMTRTQATRLKV